MRLRIHANSFLTRRYLEVNSAGIACCETALMGARKTAPFSAVLCILMSPTHELSVQVGQEVFSVPTNPGNSQHQQTIAALVREVERSQKESPPTTPPPSGLASVW